MSNTPSSLSSGSSGSSRSSEPWRSRPYVPSRGFSSRSSEPWRGPSSRSSEPSRGFSSDPSRGFSSRSWRGPSSRSSGAISVPVPEGWEIEVYPASLELDPFTTKKVVVSGNGTRQIAKCDLFPRGPWCLCLGYGPRGTFDIQQPATITGAIEKGEQPLDAIRREILEEIGLNPCEYRLVQVPDTLVWYLELVEGFTDQDGGSADQDGGSADQSGGSADQSGGSADQDGGSAVPIWDFMKVAAIVTGTLEQMRMLAKRGVEKMRSSEKVEVDYFGVAPSVVIVPVQEALLKKKLPQCKLWKTLVEMSLV